MVECSKCSISASDEESDKAKDQFCGSGRGAGTGDKVGGYVKGRSESLDGWMEF